MPRIDLPAATRNKIAPLLTARLADAIDMQARAKHAHWNITGPNFIALHELFDKVADHAENAADEIAERTRALGHDAQGLLPHAAKTTSLPTYKAKTGEDHLPALDDSLAAFGKLLRAASDTADELDDANTADLFTALSRENDKLLWFLESHES